MTTAPAVGDGAAVAGVLARMGALLAELEAAADPARFFLGTYLRTTRAVADELERGRFEDPAWVEEWDVVFARLYLDALDAYRQEPASAPRPWRIAFASEPALHPVGHVLLGVNAHINYDLPQALLAVVPAQDVADERRMASRHRDHEVIDGVLARRVAAEDGELALVDGGRSLLDRVMTPLNRGASRRFLRESRRRTWENTLELHAARLRGGDAYARRLRDLEVLSAARVHDLLRPGPVLVRLALTGFGVRLPPP